MEQQQMEQELFNDKPKKKKRINPYKILEISKDYDRQTLKKAYMTKAMVLHPDRGGNSEDFKLLGLAYKSLLKKLDDLEINMHNELKQNHEKYVNDDKQDVNYKLDKDNFDINLFNNLYDEYKLTNNFSDRGYGDWLKKEEESDYNDNSDLQNNFTSNKFNSSFDNYKDAISQSKSNSLSLSEPDELISYKEQDSLTVLGGGKIKNYSGSVNGLGFRDLKDAFENSTLINVNSINISNRSSDLNYYERSRDNTSFELNESDLLKYKNQITRQKKKEERRIRRLQREDSKIQDTYNYLHQRMLN